MMIDQFERYVLELVNSEHEAQRMQAQQLLQAALIPAFRTALAVCVRKCEEEVINLDPHQDAEDDNLLKTYRQLYNERSLYQDLLSGIERLRQKAEEAGILDMNPATIQEIGRVEDVGS